MNRAAQEHLRNLLQVYSECERRVEKVRQSLSELDGFSLEACFEAISGGKMMLMSMSDLSNYLAKNNIAASKSEENELFGYLDRQSHNYINKEELQRFLDINEINTSTRSKSSFESASKELESLLVRIFQTEVLNCREIVKTKVDLNSVPDLNLQQLFSKLDRGAKGHLDAKDLLSFLTEAGAETSAGEIERLVRRICRSSDGRVYFYPDWKAALTLREDHLQEGSYFTLSSAGHQGSDLKEFTAEKLDLLDQVNWSNKKEPTQPSFYSPAKNDTSDEEAGGSYQKLHLHSAASGGRSRALTPIKREVSIESKGQRGSIVKERFTYLQDGIKIVRKSSTYFEKPASLDEGTFRNRVMLMTEGSDLSHRQPSELQNPEDSFSFSPKKQAGQTNPNDSIYQSKDSIFDGLPQKVFQAHTDSIKEVSVCRQDRKDLLEILSEFITGSRMLEHHRLVFGDLYKSVSAGDVFRLINKKNALKIDLIEFEEFMAFFDELSSVPSVDLRIMLRVYDKDRDGALDLKEFSRLLNPRFPDKSAENFLLQHPSVKSLKELAPDAKKKLTDVIKSAIHVESRFKHNRKSAAGKIFTMFNTLDSKIVGSLTGQDMLRLFSEEDVKLTAQDAAHFMDRFDLDRDGAISFNEFVDVMMEYTI